jgi:hypothetical protein
MILEDDMHKHESDILAIKAVLAVLISDLDKESIDSLRSSAADVIQHFTLHPHSVKQEAIGAIDNMLDVAP